ncbi:CAP-associated domain-containing protein [uncultured Enterococcus sp.]|uniref:CAP-associated domain-containing protein n=1 Tax=uncultured Enterococcus sp. TaxID=167972 RepID=UPI0025CEA025|nr:CAP-associated domain-containing protein [uncultured Enterococcus sp.]
MKYRGVLFWIMLILALIIVYAQPVFSTGKPTTAVPTTAVHTTKNSYETLKSQGMATFVGKDVNQFMETYGQPTDIVETGFGYELYLYHPATKNGYIEVSVAKKTIQGIKLLGKQQADMAPFSLGMEMNDVTKLVTISPNFDFTYHEKKVTLELGEEDMNYRPLIALDDGNFVMLFLDQTTGKLYSLMYLSKELLLKLAPYTLTGKELPTFTVNESIDWQSINTAKQAMVVYLFSLLNYEQNIPAYQTSPNFDQKATQWLTEFLLHPDDYLTTQRTLALKRAQDPDTHERFLLTEDEWLTLAKVSNDKTLQVFFETPVYDPTFTLLTWKSSAYFTLYDRPVTRAMSVVFSKENMVVLIQEMETKSEESDAK